MEVELSFYFGLFGIFTFGLLIGLLSMWLILRRRIKAQENRQTEMAAQLQEALLAKERLETEAERVAELEEQIDALQESKTALTSEIAALKTSRAGDEEKITWLEQTQERMRDAFQALAAQSLASNSEEFLKRTRDSLQNFFNQLSGGWQTHKAELANLVQPLGQALQTMDQHLREMEGKREGAYGELRENLTQLAQLNQHLQSETSKLSHALRSGVHQRGRWAEFQLQRLAELAGMKERVDFNLQLGLGEARPDMVVWLPRGGCIVVDAKAPLSHYLEAMELTAEEERCKKLAEHARRVRQHIEHLHAKEYWRRLPEGAEFVVMYLPSDACLIAALDADHKLLEHAFKCRITLAAPTTFFAMLKTVANGWQQYQLTENAQQIFQQGLNLSQRLQKFSEHLAGVGKGLKMAVDKFNAAVGSYESRILPETRRFQELRGSQDGLPEVARIDLQPRSLEAAPPPNPEELD
ncbi:MAG: DNA recombination protein RmuC [Deltaproteobacteria bacterium]|nr:DNA recombination protein RmuC [Deltaproteobacteria bacterium]